MKNIMCLLLCVSLSLCLAGCSDHAGDEKITAPTAQNTASPDYDINPDNLSYNPDDYEIVLIDGDCYHLMLNEKKTKTLGDASARLITYEGVIYYTIYTSWVQTNFIGYASALYDERNQNLHFCGYDQLQTDILSYNIHFGTSSSGADSMISAYYFYKRPDYMNRIYMGFSKGSIGDHTAPAGLARISIQEATANRKK